MTGRAQLSCTPTFVRSAPAFVCYEAAAARVTVPSLFSPPSHQMLREYTKAVLRERPEDVLAFSQQWFLDKARANVCSRLSKQLDEAA